MKKYLFVLMWDLVVTNLYVTLDSSKELLNEETIKELLKHFREEKKINDEISVLVLNIIKLDD